MCRVANLLNRRAGVVLVRQVSDDVFNHHHRAIHHHAEIQRTEREKVRRNVTDVEADGSEHEREGNGECNNNRATHIAEEEKENDRDKDHAFGEIVLPPFPR